MLRKEDKDNKVTDMRQTDDSRDMRNENERRTNESAKDMMYSDIGMKRCKNDVSDKTEKPIKMDAIMTNDERNCGKKRRIDDDESERNSEIKNDNCERGHQPIRKCNELEYRERDVYKIRNRCTNDMDKTTDKRESAYSKMRTNFETNTDVEIETPNSLEQLMTRYESLMDGGIGRAKFYTHSIEMENTKPHKGKM